ncbi:MAG: molecular chaperone DnaJ [Candidatus Coatesbacteria bacterium]|nr:MAG: molecular chaperone DnaJ [Candidatus Coatesbacteria bacterium]
MTTNRDYYDILEVDRSAGVDEIKKAYRRLALQYHPDRNPDPEAVERFKEASEAAEVLTDPDKRAIYDAYGHAGLRGRGFDGFADIEDIFRGFSASGVFGDLFADLFGFATVRRGRRPKRGSDLMYRRRITFEEAAYGLEDKVEVERLMTCDVCDGTGGRDGAKPVTCATCGGTGQVAAHRGFFSVATTCLNCGGTGETVNDPCPECKGEGRKPETVTINFSIPPGADDGVRVRLTGEGESGLWGGPPGDLYIQVTVERHPLFKRQGDDIVYDLGISPAAAALGRKVTVPTIWGETGIKIPAGSQHGDNIKTRGEGMPRLRGGGKGDHFVRLSVIVPRKLSKKEKELYKKLDELEEDNSG